jgi:D-arabinose 1-dehydrogenase-like Zn-dependent alcohol dehydrogenase
VRVSEGDTVKAARFHGKEDVRVETVDEPSPGPGEVKLRNAHSGICGSDLHVFYSPESSGMDYATPHPVTGSMPPQILGHEFSGTIVDRQWRRQLPGRRPGRGVARVRLRPLRDVRRRPVQPLPEHRVPRAVQP